MKQTILLVLLFLFFGVTDLRSQNEKVSAQDAKTQAEKDEITRKRIEYKMYHLKRTSEQPVEVNVADNKYNHREKEIFEKLNTESIPDDFPIYKTEYTNDQYTTLMNAWYKEHPALLKKGTNTNQQK